ncbi:hypothetical protein AKJ47_02020 [candidate division MSBL1 archaeon SCGC-AAA261G05]|uniref:SWIM-type domain-containing protein n=5 Tax=candidate division MSBL1 TaxID=215777 RepID=A0A133UZJ3_9EURY|nr:hypothetical protein AKJ42_02925 [candidate division MSBL1 archaeon SCGC-AAA261C02]KXB03541.1 hypothetical protein AKJ47_02020 [candidate division MSBL1 archaeon SCGC-AAA261G05]KXB04719.1 hypothetical protein AKJ48_01675 [candidate division MSBL1 archaeon SCGC-AAA261O19]KXB09571.1 hypothetical protein AKJ46_00030 [candidate division MSBL1 archaeon SCGC-AAA833K04]
MTKLSKDEIRDRTEENRFEKGLKYHREDRVQNRVRRGLDLEADVEGSRLRPYRVSVSLSGDGEVLATHCSCPDDYFGDCKHIVAVLLDWLKDPNLFREVQETKPSLEDMSREELVTLIHEMLDREPHLEHLLKTPLPGFSDKSAELVDPYPFQQDVKQIFDSYQGWGDELDVAISLGSIVGRGESHLENREFGAAEAIFRSVVEETLEFYGYTHDEGEILQEVERAIDGLIQCLNSCSDRTEFRREVIDFLYWIVRWDVSFGGIGFEVSSWDAILEHAKSEDRRRLREKIIGDLADVQTEEYGHWKSYRYGRLLFDLDEIEGNVDGFLEEAKKFELHKLRALKLLDLDQKDEAIKAAKKIESPSDIIEFADGLRERGYSSEARRFVSIGVDLNPHDGLKKWLADFDEAEGDIENALKLELDRFQSSPSPSQFQRVVGLAEELNQVDEYRSQLVSGLEKNGRFDILARIFFNEGELDRAWNYASRIGESGGYLASSTRIKEEIVKAGEDSRPDRAIEFYLDEVRRLIGERGRRNYKSAASYLKRIKRIYERMRRKKEWQQLIADLREEFSGLPACQDEFDKAGL